jgi:hypothetical protein
MTDIQNPQHDEDDVEGHAKASPQVVEVDDEDDVEGHARAIRAPGVVTGALGPDDSLPSAKVM